MNEIFFDEIIPEAATGKINAEQIYNVGFNTLLPNNKYITNNKNNCYPTLNITDLNKFNCNLTKYLCAAKNFYNDKYYNDKQLLSLLLINATSDEFLNPNKYINNKINFLNDKVFSKFIDRQIIGSSIILDNSNIEVQLVKESPNLETPYSLELFITKKYDEDKKMYYPLSKVRYGISENIGYIYAIQDFIVKEKSNDKNYIYELEQYQKRIKRLLYKINNNFVEPYDGTDNYENRENLTGITPSHVLCSSIILALFEKNNINNIMLPAFLPIRYNAKEQAYKNRLDYIKKSSYEDEVQKKEYDNELEKITMNTTDKFIRNFRRLEYCFNNVNISLLPNELDSFMHIEINDNYECNNALLGEIYVSIKDNNKNNRLKY